MYKLEQAGMLEQAEITARAIDNQFVTLDTRPPHTSANIIDDA